MVNEDPREKMHISVQSLSQALVQLKLAQDVKDSE
jgi:hypothetical protein